MSNDSNFLSGSGMPMLRQDFHLRVPVPSHLNTCRLLWYMYTTECTHYPKTKSTPLVRI